MRKYTLRFREVDRRIFEALRSGEKRVETRAATPKYRGIQKGDMITAVCGNERFERSVQKASIFSSIDDLLSRYSVRDVAPDLATPDELKKQMLSFSGYREKIKQFGLVGLELE